MTKTAETQTKAYVHRENLDPEQEELLDVADELYTQKVVDQFLKFVDSGGASPPEAIIHWDARSDLEEAKRDEFLRQLSNTLEIDVEDGLNDAERDWKTKSDGFVVLEPWMKVGLGIADAEKPTRCPGISRDFDITEKDGVRYTIHEIEIPSKRQDPDMVTRDSYARIMYFSASLQNPEQA